MCIIPDEGRGMLRLVGILFLSRSDDMLIGDCFVWNRKTLMAPAADMRTLDSLRMGLMKLAYMKNCVCRVIIDRKIFVVSLLNMFFQVKHILLFIIRGIFF